MWVFGCAWKINFLKVIWSWLCKMRLWPRKWFGVKIFTWNHFRVRCAKREREKRLRHRWNQSPDRAPPKTRRREHQLRRSRPKANRRRRYRSRSRCSSAPLLPISFSFLTQSSSALPISSSRSHRTNDLVVSISSRSHRRLSFPEVFDHSLFLPFSVWPNLYKECGSFEQIFVSLKYTSWSFCNKICLWFSIFIFSLWPLICLLLLWWCGCWCFGGFPVVWWWWKIAFSEGYQTHENIF